MRIVLGVIGVLDIMTIITTLALCKVSSRADRMAENLNKTYM